MLLLDVEVRNMGWHVKEAAAAVAATTAEIRQDVGITFLVKTPDMIAGAGGGGGGCSGTCGGVRGRTCSISTTVSAVFVDVAGRDVVAAAVW